MGAKLVLHHPHIETEAGVVEYCAAYRLTESVRGVIDGEVAHIPAPGATEGEILDAIKAAAVAHANLQTADAVPFTLADVITWEARA